MLGHGRSEMRWREEDLDEYEDEEEERYGAEEEEGDEEEEEEEEEEEHKPTPEELEFLKTRERLKAKLRLKVQKENAAALGRSGGSDDRRRPLPNAEFGSFFGPSKPVIARRVIEERHSLQETQHIRARESASNHVEKRGPANMNGEKRVHAVPNGVAKPNPHAERLKAVKEIRNKAQTLKDMRDYTFLFSDEPDVPVPPRDPPPKKPSVSQSDTRSTPAPLKAKVEVKKNPAMAPEDRAFKKPTSGSQKIVPKAAPQRETSMNRPKPPPVPHNLPNGNKGSGLPRLPNGKTGPSSSQQSLNMKKPSTVSTNRPAAPASVNRSVSMDCKAPMVKSGSSSQKPDLLRRKESEGLSKGNVMTKQSLPSSKPHQQFVAAKPKNQMLASSSKPKPQLPPPRPQVQLPKPKPSKPIIQQRPPPKPVKRKPVSRYSDDEDEEGEGAISMIRQMFGYNPKKYAGMDEDDSDMEANFDTIMQEEKRSAKIGAREDEEQLRLIEEEERRERMRLMAKRKKQRLG